MTPASPKPLTWVGSSKRDYLRFPDEVQDNMGYALYVAQMATPKSEIRLVEQRLRAAEEDYRQRQAGQEGSQR
jgi:phage-related protein